MSGKKISDPSNNLRNYHVPNLERALVIFELLAHNFKGMTRNEIAAATGYTTTMVYRIVATLWGEGYLFRDDVTGRYRLSSKLLDIGVAGADEYSLVAESWPEMVELRDKTNITVMLGGLLSEFEGVVLESADSREMARFVVQRGLRVSTLHVGGWKCVLAYWPEKKLEAYFQQADFRALTNNTPTTKEAVLEALAEVRVTGYAVDDSEMTEGNHCAVAPIFERTGTPVGVLCLSGLSSQLPRTDFKLRGEQALESARRISARLGWIE